MNAIKRGASYPIFANPPRLNGTGRFISPNATKIGQEPGAKVLGKLWDQFNA